MLKFQPGDKVTYVPFKECDTSKYENGMIKSLSEYQDDHVFVVYHCNDDWQHYKDYTGALTNINQLILGWIS
jgi:hypothetical protein